MEPRLAHRPSSHHACAASPRCSGRRAGGGAISTGAAVQPIWRRDGKELFYIDVSGRQVGDSMTGDGRTAAVSTQQYRIMAVDVKSDGAGFEAGVPKPLFTTVMLSGGGVGNGGMPFSTFDVSPDGQRFLVTRPCERTGAATHTTRELHALSLRSAAGAGRAPVSSVAKCCTARHRRWMTRGRVAMVGLRRTPPIRLRTQVRAVHGANHAVVPLLGHDAIPVPRIRLLN